VKGAALGLIVVVACLIAAASLIGWPTVYRESTTRSGAGDRPPGLHMGPFSPLPRPIGPTILRD
jgi:hypothetical protein